MIDTSNLLATVDLKALIAHDTEVHGNRALCPFCQSGGGKSFAMGIYDNRYYCYGCSSHGNAINYIMQRDNLSFLSACQRLGWKDGIGVELLRQKQAVYEHERLQKNQERELELDALLKDYTAQELWLAYQRKMTDENKAWWRNRGVPDSWQDYLRLGYTPDKVYVGSDQQTHHSPAYTIPYFTFGFAFKNLQFRLTDPFNPKDRYRFEKNLKTVFYDTTPSNKIQDKVIITEGAIKGIVCRLKGVSDDWSWSVYAIPSKVDYGAVASAVSSCGRVYIILDPDAWVRPVNAPNDWIPSPVKLARLIGEQSRIVSIPTKVDDGFIYYRMSQQEFMGALRQAVKL